MSALWTAKRLLLTLLGCAGAVLVVGCVCFLVGSTGVGWPHAGLWRIRLEPVMDSALIGFALAMAGVAYQAVLRNPLADPYLLGVSSGASLTAYIWRLPALAVLASARWGGISQQGMAFAGALAAVILVLGVAGRRGRLEPVTLLLTGVIVNAVNGSVFLLINSIVRDMPVAGGTLTFLVGGIQDVTANQRMCAAVIIAVCALVLLVISGQLNVAMFDDGEAESLGVRIHRVRWIAIIAASLATAAAVAISGPIGFIGLICPHAARAVVGSDQRRLVPIAASAGAILLMLADAATRLLAAENLLATKLPVGVLTGLLGGPFFLWLLLRGSSLGKPLRES